MAVIGQIRLDHIYKSSVEGIAELVKAVPGFPVQFTVFAAPDHLVEFISVNDECSRIGNLKGVLRVLVIERVAGSPIADDAADGGINDQQPHNHQDAPKRNTLTDFVYQPHISLHSSGTAVRAFLQPAFLKQVRF